MLEVIIISIKWEMDSWVNITEDVGIKWIEEWREAILRKWVRYIKYEVCGIFT